MVASHHEAPLLFLTTFNSSAPIGRNVRAQARSASAKQTNPVKENHGSFGSFIIEFGSDASTTTSGARPAKRRKAVTDESSTIEKIDIPTDVHRGFRLMPLKILATHFPTGGSPLPPNINFEDVLKVAAFHIRRNAAQMINSHPERIVEALRCRQWCVASAVQASLGRSSYLDHAIACVVSKVQQVVSGNSSTETMLSCYSEALHSLRDALRQPSQNDCVDMLSATHLLAIYEMLDFPNNVSWTQHVDGAAALVKLSESTRIDNAAVTMHAGPMFVEALLSNDIAFLESKYWKSIVAIMANRRHGLGLDSESVACFTSLRSIFADYRAILEISSNNISWAARWPLLSRAHELRFRMRSLILQSEKDIISLKKNSKGLDVLGLYLVSFIMLDRMILSLRQDTTTRGFNLEEDTQGLCNQMVRFELAASDANPGKDILQALKRQARYPSLMYSI